MLLMDVPADINQVEPKNFFGWSVRQLISLGIVVFIGGVGLVLQFVAPSVGRVTTRLLPLLIVPVMVFGWWRPHGLHPEKYVRLIYRWWLLLKPRPVLHSGRQREALGISRHGQRVRVDEHTCLAGDKNVSNW
ncbi:PrgI family protein [Scardovia wiggsiae]|uniref:PrgI family protein n=1 Tax=Scardovia wiggsiae TaxID=230143 RepID=UPI003BAB45F2